MNESLEMYLETILLLSKNNKELKAIDVAKKMNYSKPSVSNALNNLKDKELIEVINNVIKLTEKGFYKAEYVYEKHSTITEFLVKTLSLDIKEAEINACKIEHIITDGCFERMKDYVTKKSNINRILTNKNKEG